MAAAVAAPTAATPTAAELADAKLNHIVAAQLCKTKMCAMFARGSCNDAACRFAHSSKELREVPNLTKTAMCRAFARGQCRDANCKFAHGVQELRVTPSVYKTQLCNFFERGHCKKGAACRHAHGVSELRSCAPSKKEESEKKAEQVAESVGTGSPAGGSPTNRTPKNKDGPARSKNQAAKQGFEMGIELEAPRPVPWSAAQVEELKQEAALAMAMAMSSSGKKSPPLVSPAPMQAAMAPRLQPSAAASPWSHLSSTTPSASPPLLSPMTTLSPVSRSGTPQNILSMTAQLSPEKDPGHVAHVMGEPMKIQWAIPSAETAVAGPWADVANVLAGCPPLPAYTDDVVIGEMERSVVEAHRELYVKMFSLRMAKKRQQEQQQAMGLGHIMPYATGVPMPGADIESLPKTPDRMNGGSPVPWQPRLGVTSRPSWVV